MQYTTNNKIKQFIKSTKKIFDNENSLKIELMRAIGEHPNYSREQQFFLRVLEELKFFDIISK